MALRITTAIPYRFDISIHAEGGETIALVEVKNAKVLSRDVAVELYRDIIAESGGLHAPYFLLLSQRLGFLWERRGIGEEVAPTLEFSMEGVVAGYLSDLGAGEWLRGRELTFIVSQWLVDLATERGHFAEEPERSLAKAGFLAAIEGASVTIGTASPSPRAHRLVALS